MNKPKIAFDIDNTLAECGKAVNKVLDACGFNPDWYHSSYDFLDTIDKQHHKPAKAIINTLFDHPPFFANLEPISGALTALRYLHVNEYADCYITARRYVHHKTTLAWLKKHDFPELPLYTDAHAADKAEIALKRGCNTLVDDHVDNARAAIEAGLHAILPLRSYNKNFHHAHANHIFMEDLPHLLSYTKVWGIA